MQTVENIFEEIHHLEVSHRPKHFVVLGAGGTGGYLIPNLARQLSIINKQRNIQSRALHKLSIVDADEVEDKNLTRQNFIKADIKKNKASVMAQRYSRAFEIDIEACELYIEKEEDISDLLDLKKHMPVIIGCVDNNKTREIVSNFHNKTPSIYIDSGNEEYAGQVVFGYKTQATETSSLFKNNGNRPYAFDLPDIGNLHPEVLNGKDKLPTELSCAERTESAPQNIFTNMTAANIAMGFLNNVITDIPITTHAVYFDSKANIYNTKLNKASILEQYKKDPELKRVE